MFCYYRIPSIYLHYIWVYSLIKVVHKNVMILLLKPKPMVLNKFGLRPLKEKRSLVRAPHNFRKSFI